MSQSEFRNKTRLKKKDLRELENRLQDFSGTEVSLGAPVDRASYRGDRLRKFQAKELEIYIANKEIVAFSLDGDPLLSLKGILKYGSSQRVLTVDMGAVSFLYNGADVMAPGIVQSSQDFMKGQIVWVRDVKNQRPLVMGFALMDAGELQEKKTGKAVKTFHHIGDFLWNAQF